MNKDEIVKIFCNITGAENVDPTMNRRELEGWDSFNHLILIMELENASGIKLHSAKVQEINTLADLLKAFGE